MTWSETADVEQFLAAAGDLLLPDPGLHTIALTQAEHVRAGRQGTTFAWWTDPAGAVTGAALHAAPYPMLLCAAPEGSLLPLMLTWQPEQVSGPTALAVQAAALLALPFGRTARLTSAQRLFRLGELVAPTDVSGIPRPATAADRDTVLAWFEAFVEEGRIREEGVEAVVDQRLAQGAFLLWDDKGPKAMASSQPRAFGAVRIGPVYTPPEHRGRGYGAAVTAAVSQRALDDGASEVVLFTDLTNPTANALYPRLGFVPVSDRAVLTISS